MSTKKQQRKEGLTRWKRRGGAGEEETTVILPKPKPFASSPTIGIFTVPHCSPASSTPFCLLLMCSCYSWTAFAQPHIPLSELNRFCLNKEWWDQHPCSTFTLTYPPRFLCKAFTVVTGIGPGDPLINVCLPYSATGSMETGLWISFLPHHIPCISQSAHHLSAK